MCEKNILIPKREVQIKPVHTMKSIIGADLDNSWKPVVNEIKTIISDVAKILLFKMLSMSQTLVYRHIPLYSPNNLKENILRTNRTVIFVGFK